MATTMKAAVLGCGPAGLLAAHGLAQGAAETGMDLDLRIYSLKQRSPLYGCQYLHAPVPGLELDRVDVHYNLMGSIEGYRRKVYGMEDVAASPQLLEANHSAWNIRQAYDLLWGMYHKYIEEYFLSLGSFLLLEEQLTAWGADHVISTVPSPLLCEDQREHTFSYERVWAMGDAPALGRFAEMPFGARESEVVCSGRPEDSWYRISKVFGHSTVEWPAHASSPKGASFVQKPTRNDCTCQRGLFRSGRYARWQKGVLAHESYEDGYTLATT